MLTKPTELLGNLDIPENIKMIKTITHQIESGKSSLHSDSSMCMLWSAAWVKQTTCPSRALPPCPRKKKILYTIHVGHLFWLQKCKFR